MRRLPTWVRDALLPVAALVIGALELATSDLDKRGYGLALYVVACSALVFRRRLPLVAPTTAGVIAMLPPFIDPSLDEPATPVLILIIAIYSLARYGELRRGLLGFAVIAIAFFLYYVYADRDTKDPTDIIFVLSLTSPPFVLGRLTRKLAHQAHQLKVQQELVKRQAVHEERDRIARDLHDVMAHSISAMVLQTAAAEDLVRTDPAHATELLQNVARTGRDALAETGRLLHAIREGQAGARPEPTPGLARLTELVETTRSAGLQIDLEVEGPLPVLPVAADVSAYRVVQEVLTNALKYAPDARVALTLGSVQESVFIRASNWCGNGRPSGSGLGLLGMQERLTLLGGNLEYGVTEAGRFELTATLPREVKA